jgi:protein-S-isoprenylcysteine O-methyltransferase Ste14
LREERNERCDGAAEQSTLAADHLSGAIAVSVLLNVFFPLPWFGQPLLDVLFVAGWLMIAAFVALNISAIRVMRRAGTTVRPDRGTDHLVIAGPFSFTRNPLYLAGTTLVLGIGLVSVRHRALARPTGHETFATHVGGTKVR